MLIAKAGSHGCPDAELLDRIERVLGEPWTRREGAGVVGRLKTSYSEMLVEQAGSQDDPTAELLDRVERALAEAQEAPGNAPRNRNSRPRSEQRPVNGRRRRRQGAGHPDVPPGHYRGLGVTSAYRKFTAEFGMGYSMPQIRNALLQGGLVKDPSSLLTAIHGIKRRDRIKAERKGSATDVSEQS